VRLLRLKKQRKKKTDKAIDRSIGSRRHCLHEQAFGRQRSQLAFIDFRGLSRSAT
jgi:hypothetical protein